MNIWIDIITDGVGVIIQDEMDVTEVVDTRAQWSAMAEHDREAAILAAWSQGHIEVRYETTEYEESPDAEQKGTDK